MSQSNYLDTLFYQAYDGNELSIEQVLKYVQDNMQNYKCEIQNLIVLFGYLIPMGGQQKHYGAVFKKINDMLVKELGEEYVAMAHKCYRSVHNRVYTSGWVSIYDIHKL